VAGVTAAAEAMPRPTPKPVAVVLEMATWRSRTIRPVPSAEAGGTSCTSAPPEATTEVRTAQSYRGRAMPYLPSAGCDYASAEVIAPEAKDKVSPEAMVFEAVSEPHSTRFGVPAASQTSTAVTVSARG
jgi:hypothetical protein